MNWIIVLCICAAAVAAYFLMTAGRRPNPDEQWLTKWCYAHRGLHDDTRPENSMVAFEAAIEAGYGIELDVHLSKDGVVMVFHDDDLERMTGRKGRIEDMTFEELEKLRLAGTDQRIPRFEDVLSMVAGQVPLLIETKNLGFGSSLQRKMMALLSSYRGKFALQSFSPFSVHWFRKKAPWDPRGQLSFTFTPYEGHVPRIAQFFVRHLLGNFLGRPNFISYGSEGLDSPVVRRLRRHGLPVLAWTIRSAKEAAKARPLCDTIIFEGFRPDPWHHHASQN